MEEHVPARFGRAPQFTYPSRSPARNGASLYEYRLRSFARGVFEVGPVAAEFTDPFGLGTSRHLLGGTDSLVVTPAPLDWWPPRLSGSRGTTGRRPPAARRTPATTTS
jgi:uncharacterized protein (DUF58 family)